MTTSLIRGRGTGEVCVFLCLLSCVPRGCFADCDQKPLAGRSRSSPSAANTGTTRLIAHRRLGSTGRAIDLAAQSSRTSRPTRLRFLGLSQIHRIKAAQGGRFMLILSQKDPCLEKILYFLSESQPRHYQGKALTGKLP